MRRRGVVGPALIRRIATVLLLCCAVWLWLGALHVTRACAAEQLQAVTLEALLDIARRENPEIRAAEARYQAMRQRPVQEGTLPDPAVGVRYHNEEFDRITFGESDFSFVEVSAEQEIPFPGKLGLRAKIAAREAEREGAMRDLTVLMVLAKVAVTYSDLAVIERSTDILRDSAATLDLLVEQAETSYRVGLTAQQDTLRARLERGALTERLTMLAQKRVAAVAALNALLNQPASQELPPAAGLPEPSAPVPLETLTHRVAAESPELRAAKEDVLRSGVAVTLAQREYFPDFALMGAYTNKSDLMPEWEAGVRVTVPLYFWRRQRPAVTEATYAKSAADHQRRNTQVSLEARLRELHSMTETSYRLVRLYADGLVPQASLTLESARASYAVGKVDFLSTLNAFTAYLEYRLRYAEEIGNLYKARAEIGPLVGDSPLAWEKRQ